MFPDDESRRRAVERFERALRPRTLMDLLKFLIAVAIMLAIPLVVSYLISRVLLPPLGRWNSRIGIALMLLGYVLLVYVAIRRDVPKALRKELLDCGVPVCLKCGYSLRGLPRDRSQCPECGRAFDDRVLTLIRSIDRETPTP